MFKVLKVIEHFKGDDRVKVKHVNNSKSLIYVYVNDQEINSYFCNGSGTKFTFLKSSASVIREVELYIKTYC